MFAFSTNNYFLKYFAQIYVSRSLSQAKKKKKDLCHPLLVCVEGINYIAQIL